jgi:hypothetical protein
MMPPGSAEWDKWRRVSWVVLGASLVVFVSLAGYILQTLADPSSAFRFAAIADRIGPLYNFKMKRFYPCYVALASMLALAHYLWSPAGCRRSSAWLLVAVGAASTLLLMWSRTAMVLLIVASGAVIVHTLVYGRRVNRGRLLGAGAVVGALVVLVGPYLSSEGARAWRRLASTLETVSRGDRITDLGDVRRFERIADGIEVGFGAPLGGMFRIVRHPVSYRFDVLETESGYVDAAVTGGPLAFAVVVGVLVMASVRAWGTASQAATVPDAHVSTVVGVAGAVTGALLVGNLWLNFLTEPYIAPFVWFCIGAAVGGPQAFSDTSRVSAMPSVSTSSGEEGEEDV